MEFGEKLQELRKSRGLTQEELAEALYVSRTAVSKWESCRGYPNIESLKEISGYFNVSIDELLSGEKLIQIAEKENQSNIRRMCDLLTGITDLFSFMLIILPLYPKAAGEEIYAVNLLRYTETSVLNRMVCWGTFPVLFLLGAAKVLLVNLEKENAGKAVTAVSMALGAAAVLFLALAREAYAAALCFVLFLIKGILLYKYA